MENNRRTSEELLKECDVLLEECPLITHSLWAQLGPTASIREATCEELLKECGELIDECHLINDTIQGWLGTKASFRDEVLANLFGSHYTSMNEGQKLEI